MLKELSISRETLFSIASEVNVLPVVKKANFNERVPSSLNFGLNFIDVNSAKIVPRFVRCNFEHENTRIPQKMFDYLEFSKTALQVLKQYVQTFSWLVEAIEDTPPSNRVRKEFRVDNLFGKQKDVNIHAYREFVKLY